MSRKPVTRNLPPLASVVSRVPIARQDNQYEETVVRLRAVAEKMRSTEDIPFYSIRSTAHSFKISYSTVARAFDRLEAEGLLRLIRGSKTILRSRKLAPKHPVLGVVGLAVLYPSFMY